MATEYVIDSGSANAIRNDISTLNNKINVIHDDIGQVKGNVSIVNNEIQQLRKQFNDYVYQQVLQNRFQLAETRLVKLKQELITKFGHYEVIRRTTVGILQADDLGIVRKETIQTATEEMMITTPRYWLAPCLVALSAWINDNQNLAEKALKEGIKRNDEKTSLLFALICRRANRKPASLKWIKRYLDNQDEENLDFKAIIIIDAFVSGLLGVDSENLVFNKLESWLERLGDKPGFAEQQTQEWVEAIKGKRVPNVDIQFKYLPQYSHTWPQMENVMEGAQLHGIILSYFNDIFDKEVNVINLKEQLDGVLTSLVSDFDEEEIPLREQYKQEELVVQFKGDEPRAKQLLQQNKAAFAQHKNFTTLLTDAAMRPDIAHASPATQKFAIALSKDWIEAAYKDVIAENRSHIPNEIDINVDTFNGKTIDGSNEIQLKNDFIALANQEEATELIPCEMTSFNKFCFGGGIVVAILGLLQLFSGSYIFGLLIMIIGIGMVFSYYGARDSVAATRKNIMDKYNEKRQKGTEIIGALMAEVVDFRREFSEKD